MSTPIGKCTVTLAGNTLPITFNSRSLYVLSKLTGEGPFVFAQRFSGLEGMTVEQQAMHMCDLTLAIPLLIAGLSAAPGFSQHNLTAAEAKVAKLLDAEAAAKGESVLVTAGKAIEQIVGAFVESLQGPKSSAQEPPQGNAGAPPVEGAPKISTGES